MASTGEVGVLSDLGARRNSIGFLRLAAAMAVLVGHSFSYGGYGTDPLVRITGNQIGMGRVAVDVFFILSGYLIAASWERLPPGRFLWHRALRIYPAYWVCLVLTALVLAPAVGAGPDWGHIAQNWLLVVGQDRAVDGVPFDGGIANAALWTLPWELRAYLLVALLGGAGLLRRVPVVAGLFTVLWATFIAAIFMFPGAEQTSPAVTSGVRLLTFFFAGTLAYLLRDRIRLERRWFGMTAMALVAATAVGITLDYSGGFFYVVAPIPLTYATFYLAARLPFHRINSGYDLSYGCYIYGTLVLHVLAAAWGPARWTEYILGALLATGLLAAASWFLVEKPALSLKGLAWRQVVANDMPSRDTQVTATGTNI